MEKFLEITYPTIFSNKYFLIFWKNFVCKYGFHLFDEVFSTGWKNGKHYLICDACEITIIIDDDPTHTHEYELENE